MFFQDLLKEINKFLALLRAELVPVARQRPLGNSISSNMSL